MNPTLLQAYDATRDFTRKGVRAACYAPYASLFFDTLGRVRACCVNRSYLLGNIRQRRLDDIWTGPGVEALREALRNYDFGSGCEHCAWQIADVKFSRQDGYAHAVHALKYDEFDVPARGPFWPANMEFNLSNVCNLACVMCTGEFSSAIRARREKLPPLPRPYGDEFFADLRKYLPHLRNTQFLGGEPFLVREHFRVWDLLIDDGLTPTVFITTNATQFHRQVERVLDRLPVSITLSLDSIRRETLEQIRLGVRYDEVMANLHRFHAYCRARGTSMGFNYVLMRSNWRELRDFLLFADGLDCGVALTIAIDPSECSLYTLADDELARVVEALQREAGQAGAPLARNQTVWDRALADLGRRLEQRAAGQAVFRARGMTQHFERQVAVADAAEMSTEQARRVAALIGEHGREKVDSFRADLDDRIEAVEAADQGLFAQIGEELRGLYNPEFFAALQRHFGHDFQTLEGPSGIAWPT